jgi:tetratricopeptide (TPR) repeat protein
MSQEEILQVMQNFTTALGVDCAHCHAQTTTSPGRGGRGRGSAAFDYVSDEKPQKKTARAMVTMVRNLNASVATAVGRPPEATTRVDCITCHRGVAVPIQLAEALDRAVKQRGTAEAVTTYRDLRRRYFGAQAYDFSENSLIDYADRALRVGRPDDAITWLELNLSYFPRSSSTYAALSNVQQRKKDITAAIGSLERAVALNPDNIALRRQLDQLRTSPK